MSFAEDLLQQARHLASVDPGVPSQANLRRAISASYYALFHLLTVDASRRFGSNMPERLQLQIARAFAHTEMKQVCRSISSGNLSPALRDLFPSGVPVALARLAAIFIRLQAERHKADYDLSVLYLRIDARAEVAVAEEAFALWSELRDSEEADVFLTSLLLHNRWSK